MKRFGVVLAAAVALAGCATLGPVTSEIALGWKPSREVHPAATLAYGAFGERSVEVQPFADARGERELVGQGIVAGWPEHRFVTRDDGAAWVTESTRTVLREAQVNVVQAGGTFVVGGELKKMFVVETDRYRSVLVLHLTVKGDGGRTLYERDVVGVADNWGRSLMDWNYREALSDAVIDALEQVLRDERLQTALDARKL